MSTHVIVPASPHLEEEPEEIEDFDDEEEEKEEKQAAPRKRRYSDYTYGELKRELKDTKRANVALEEENAALRESVRLNRALFKQEMLKWAHMCKSVVEWVNELDLD
jgi:hypothetical protein